MDFAIRFLEIAKVRQIVNKKIGKQVVFQSNGYYMVTISFYLTPKPSSEERVAWPLRCKSIIERIKITFMTTL